MTFVPIETLSQFSQITNLSLFKSKQLSIIPFFTNITDLKIEKNNVPTQFNANIISQLMNLESLSVDLLPLSSTKLSHLTFLSFASSKITDEHFISFTNLKHLELSGNLPSIHNMRITDVFLKHFTNLEKIKVELYSKDH